MLSVSEWDSEKRFVSPTTHDVCPPPGRGGHDGHGRHGGQNEHVGQHEHSEQDFLLLDVDT